MTKALDGIKAAEDRVDKKCPDEVKASVESAEKKLAGAKSDIKGSVDEMKSLTKTISVKEKIDKIFERLGQ